MKKIDFKAHLNAEQFTATTAPDGPILVLAAAGTGKTRTLVYRVAYLVQNGIDPSAILLLTFTNKAAREMLDRACDLVGKHVGGLWGGTFHHMANRILRKHAADIGYRADYAILDRDDTMTLIRQSVKECHLTAKEFPKAEVLAGIFGMAANTSGSVADISIKRFAEEVDAADICAVHKQYETKKRSLNAMDFDDLLVHGLELFRTSPSICQYYQNRFRYVLVDEYQDTNVIQSDWIDLVAAGYRNIMVVGDDFQSIYSWRGANFRNIMSFPQRYPDTTIYKLETNYRSVPEILDVANACIEGNPEQFQKTLRSTRDAYRKPSLIRLRDGDAQAQYVIEHLRHLRREGYKWSDMAVLYRAHFHAMELQLQLYRSVIPFTITSGVRFFEQAHIKDVTSLLRLLRYPGDQLAFCRLLSLLSKVGEKTALRIWDRLGRSFNATSPENQALVREALPSIARMAWADICASFALWSPAHDGHNAGDVVSAFIEKFYHRYANNTFENADRRMEDLDELISHIAQYDDIDAFLNEIALLTNLDAETAAGAAVPGDAIRLSTIHQAKGLEWGAVVILWATEGMFPSGRSIEESLEGESEERRLFYVAVTRAKDELAFCVPEVRRMHDGGMMPVAMSRFLREIPADMVEEKRVTFSLWK